MYPVHETINKLKKPIVINHKKILNLINSFSKKSELFLTTGGVHSSALCSENEIIYFEEDIGRHNAVDKIIGRALINGLNFSDKLVLTTGRVSSEILVKIAKHNIPILVSRSAPTSNAINIAKEKNISLIGFARGNRMNIYNHFKEIVKK